MASRGPSASERAYQAIREGILDGTYPPGTMLGEASFAVEINVSRTPVRVALARLQDEGWIAIYPQRGALVRGLGEREATELADARFILESTSVSRASDTFRCEQSNKLDELIGRQREALGSSDVRAFVELTLEFHRGFVEAANNGVLLELYDRLTDRHRFVLFASGERLLERSEEILAEHAELVGCLRAADEEGFERVLRAHISELPR